MEQKTIKIGNFSIGNQLPIAIIAGPCQIESREHAIDIAGKMVEITKELGVNYIFIIEDYKLLIFILDYRLNIFSEVDTIFIAN